MTVKANQESSGCNLFTQSSVGKQLTTSVTDENNPRKAMLGSVLKGTGVEEFELDLRGSSLVLDKKKFKTDVLQRATNSQQQWTTGKGSIVCQHRLNNIKVSMFHCVFVLSPALGGTWGGPDAWCIMLKLMFQFLGVIFSFLSVPFESSPLLTICLSCPFDFAGFISICSHQRRASMPFLLVRKSYWGKKCILRFILIYMYVCVLVWVCTSCALMQLTTEAKKKGTDALELELQVLVSLLPWVVIRISLCVRAPSALNHWSIASFLRQEISPCYPAIPFLPLLYLIHPLGASYLPPCFVLSSQTPSVICVSLFLDIKSHICQLKRRRRS